MVARYEAWRDGKEAAELEASCVASGLRVTPLRGGERADGCVEAEDDEVGDEAEQQEEDGEDQEDEAEAEAENEDEDEALQEDEGGFEGVRYELDLEGRYMNCVECSSIEEHEAVCERAGGPET